MKPGISKDSSSVVAGIIGFLKDKGKSNLLSSVAEVLDSAVDRKKRADKIIVTSAVPLSKHDLSILGNSISKFLDTKLPVTNVIEKKLIAGFSIRVGDFFLDASVLSEITTIRNLLVS